MKIMRSTVLCIALLLCITQLLATVNALPPSSDGILTFKDYPGEGTGITQCSKNYSGALDIVTNYAEKDIRFIDSSAFSGCTKLTEVVIPDTVERIKYSAFYDCTALRSVTIPDSVTILESGAFSNCSSLELVMLPGNLTTICSSVFSGCTSLRGVGIGSKITSIESYAFKNCESLAAIAIPASVTYIDPTAFNGCTALSAVVVDANNPNYSSDSCGAIYNKDGTELLWAPKNVDTFTVPEGVLTIGGNAFANCAKLTQVVLPNTVIKIDDFAFSGCTELTKIEIPNSLRNFGEYVFDNCPKLQYTIRDKVKYLGNAENPYYLLVERAEDVISVDVPQGAAVIATSAFSALNYRCSLERIALPDSLITIGDAAFSYCSSLQEMVIPENVTYIGEGAFRGTGLHSVIIPDCVTYMGSMAFYVCRDLTSVTIGSGLNQVYSDTFGGCENLAALWVDENNPCYSSDSYGVIMNKEQTEIVLVPQAIIAYTIPDGVTAIESSTFDACSKLESVVIGNHVESIKTAAFSGCKKLKSVFMGNGVSHIGNMAFQSCSSLKEITFGENVTSIGSNAFQNCKALQEITIGGKISMIGQSAFRGCTALRTLTVGDSVTVLDDYAFEGCTGLITASINCEGVIGEYAFANCTGLTDLTIGEKVTTIDYYAFNACEGLTELVIGGGVSSIKNGAFLDCAGLRDLVIGDSVTSIGMSAFGRCTDLVTVTIGNGLSYIDHYVFSGCESLTDITLTVNIESLFPWAFQSCSSLKNIYYNGTQEQWNAILNGKDKAVLDATLHTEHIHEYSTEVVVATCLSEGYTLHTCTAGHTRRNNFISSLGHSFTNYIPNNDANYYIDGTKSAKCDRCEETDTISDVGSAWIPEGNMILLQPETVNMDSGNTVTFSIVTFGEIVSYQWQYRKIYKWFDTTMTGYDTDTLTVPATGARNGYDYRCIVTFADGTVLYSDPAELTVKTYMNITYHPNDQTVVLGYKGQFTAKADGEGIKFQWQYKRPNTDQWYNTNMEGCTKATVYIETSTARDGYQYRCQITDVTGNVRYTEAATMRVLSFTDHPDEAFAAPGTNVQFTVAASVTEGFTYQWQYRRSGVANWTNTSMTGYNTATLTVAATKARNGYQYRCVLTGSKNSVIESKAAVLNVSDPVVISGQPQNVTCAVGGVATFNVVVENAYAYQWQFYNPRNAVWKNTSADGNTTDTLNVTVKSNNNNYQYRCIVYGLDGIEYISDPATLTLG